MLTLDSWFEKESARQERAVYLEDALLSGRFAGYVRYRLRFFLGRCAIDALIHISEFLFLAFIFEQQKLVSALLVRVSSQFLSAWWWGALESLRGQVREIHRNGKTHLLAKILSGWLRFATFCAAATLLLLIGWVLLDSMRVSRRFDVFHCYILAVGSRFAVGLVCQTFHSAVYAIRRIYRPFLAIVGVDIIGFLGTLLMWPFFGAWSFPVILLVAGFSANAITLVYVGRAYRIMGLPPLRLTGGLRLRTAFSRILTRHFFGAGFAQAFTRLENVLVLSLFDGASNNKAAYRLFILFYLISPLVQASYSWAQLFYFDLKRLELDLFVYFKQRFAASLRWVSLVLGALFWLLACVVATLISRRNLGELYAILLLFFLVRSWLAFYQVRAFSEGQYRLLILTGLAMIVGFSLVRSLTIPGEQRFGLFVLLLLAGFVLLVVGSIFGLRIVRGSAMLAVPDWLRRLRMLRDSVRLRVASLSRDAEDWQVQQIARKIVRSVRASGEVARIGKRRIAWYEFKAAAAAALRDASVLRYGGGLIEGLRNGPYAANGGAAIALARQTGLLGGALDGLTDGPSPGDLEEIKQRFSAQFPGAILFDAAQQTSVPLEGLSRCDCRQVMAGALQFSKNLFRRVRKASFDVTTLCEAGRIRLIFGIPRSQPATARDAWKAFINKVNVFNAITPNPPIHGGIMPTLFKQTSLWLSVAATSALLLGVIQMEERVTGSFLLKSTEQTKVYAPVAGFVKSLDCQQGEHLTAGSIIARVEIPDLASRLAQTRAALKEAEAMHRLLATGVRPEELAEQRARVSRAQAWRDKAQQELKDSLQQDSQQLAGKIEQSRHELEFARESYTRSQKLHQQKILSIEALERTETDFHVKQAQIEEALAEQGARQASIVLRAQSELVDREQDLAEARASLNLMLAGTRPELIEAKHAEVERLNGELAYLEDLEKRQDLVCPADGVIATPYLETRIGTFLREGDLFCEVAAPSSLIVEISLPEEEAARVRIGQRIELKTRSLPYQIFTAKVDRIAPIIEDSENGKQVRVYCRLNQAAAELRPGMSGFARVYLGRRAAGSVLLDRLARFVRFEFWW